jgi:hypothetical protein
METTFEDFDALEEFLQGTDPFYVGSNGLDGQPGLEHSDSTCFNFEGFPGLDEHSAVFVPNADLFSTQAPTSINSNILDTSDANFHVLSIHGLRLHSCIRPLSLTSIEEMPDQSSFQGATLPSYEGEDRYYQPQYGSICLDDFLQKSPSLLCAFGFGSSHIDLSSYGNNMSEHHGMNGPGMFKIVGDNPGIMSDTSNLIDLTRMPRPSVTHSFKLNTLYYLSMEVTSQDALSAAYALPKVTALKRTCTPPRGAPPREARPTIIKKASQQANPVVSPFKYQEC